jgi:dienelactone hydrolase
VPHLYQKNSFKILLFFTSCLFYGCAAAGAILVPLESIDPPSGKYNIGTQVYFWTDNSRGEVYTTDPTDFRELMVQIWYPAQEGKNYQKAPHVTFPKKAISSIARTAGLPASFGRHGTQLTSNSIFGLLPIQNKKFPLILFSHGDGGLLNQNTSQVEELVSNGYIVIACNHTYNASITFDKEGNPIPYKQNVSWNEQAQYHKKYYTNLLINYRYQDLAFLLKTLKQKRLNDGSLNPFQNNIDFEKVGAMGHSMGGGTTYMAMLKNNEVKAGVALDGWFFGLLDEEAKTNTKKPFLHIGQEQFLDAEIDGDINFSKDGKRNFDIYNTILDTNKESYGVYIKNSLHYSFTDMKLIYNQRAPFSLPLDSLGEVDKKIIDDVMDKIVLDFFNYILKDGTFVINNYNTYQGEVIFNKYISRELLK